MSGLQPGESSSSISSSGKSLRSTGMLSRQQLLRLFELFSIEISKPEVKRRIADAVRDKQEAIAITTEIQEELFLQMEIDPQFGIACLAKVNTVFENDTELMIQFYRFVAQEELVCDEAELEPEAFMLKMRQKEQQLVMLKQMREYSIPEQSSILNALREQMEQDNFEGSNAIMTPGRMRELVDKMRS